MKQMLQGGSGEPFAMRASTVIWIEVRPTNSKSVARSYKHEALSRKDDMESLAYTTFELYASRLPWSRIRGTVKTAQDDATQPLTHSVTQTDADSRKAQRRMT